MDAFFKDFTLQAYKRIKTKLHRVKINFDTPTFLLIKKDEKANLGDKLSAIGGTMGLLTGFSLISGVEIIYFAVRICLKLIRKRIDNAKTHIV
jgi:hypothetical protein